MKKSEAKEAKRKKKKTMLIATLATAALIVGGLTFAWYTSKDSVTNTFKTAGSLKTVVVENFTPPTNWQPGVTTDKVVQVTNTGTVDAYTRVQLSEDLTYYEKNGTELLSDSTAYTSETYVTVNKEAIIDSITNWNKDTSNPQFTQIISGGTTGYESLVSGYTLPSSADNYTSEGLHIWVKEATASSTDTDKAQVETGKNIEFIGYYVKGTEAYEIEINPTIVYKAAAAGDDNPATDSTTGKSVYTDNINLDTTGSKIVINVYKANKQTVTGTNIKDYVEIEFNEVDASANTAGWIYKDGYFYYNQILNSGETTIPLIKAVRLKNTVGDEMINATYNLKVYNDSTQATDAAAAAVFIGTSGNATFAATGDTAFSTVILNKATNIIQTGTDCDYSAVDANKVVCSDSTSTDVAAFNAQRGYREQTNISTTSAGTADTTTTTTDSTTTTTTVAQPTP
jgi:alternate signal-mediated exported protein